MSFRIGIKLKVKVILVQALRLCTGRTAYRGSRGIALPFHNHSTKRGCGVSVTPRSIFTPGKDPVPIVQEAGWAQGRSGQVRKIQPALGFDPRTVQPVASRCKGDTKPGYIGCTSCSRIILEKLMVPKVVKKISLFTQRSSPLPYS